MKILNEKEKRHQMRHDLVDLFNLLKNPENWCQRALARDESGEQLFNAWDERAYSFCILGALDKNGACNETYMLLSLLLKSNNYSSEVNWFNDHAEHKEVIDFIMKALQCVGGKV